MFTYAKPEQKQVAKSTVQKKDSEKAVSLPNLTGIPKAMKTRFENISGFSFDDVRVHYNSGKPAQLRAVAYTQGNQVYVAPGQKQHLGHELGHVVHQKQGKVKPIKNNNILLNDSPEMEQEADNLHHLVQCKHDNSKASKIALQNNNIAMTGFNGVVQRRISCENKEVSEKICRLAQLSDICKGVYDECEGLSVTININDGSFSYNYERSEVKVPFTIIREINIAEYGTGDDNKKRMINYYISAICHELRHAVDNNREETKRNQINLPEEIAGSAGEKYYQVFYEFRAWFEEALTAIELSQNNKDLIALEQGQAIDFFFNLYLDNLCSKNRDDIKSFLSTADRKKYARLFQYIDFGKFSILIAAYFLSENATEMHEKGKTIYNLYHQFF